VSFLPTRILFFPREHNLREHIHFIPKLGNLFECLSIIGVFVYPPPESLKVFSRRVVSIEFCQPLSRLALQRTALREVYYRRHWLIPV